MNDIADEVKTTVDLAMTSIEDFAKASLAQMKAPRTRRQPLDDVQRWTQKLQEYPPERWLTDKGMEVEASPFLLALDVAQRGKGELQRIERTFSEGGY